MEARDHLNSAKRKGCSSPSVAGSASPAHPSTVKGFVSLTYLWGRETPDALIWYAGGGICRRSEIAYWFEF